MRGTFFFTAASNNRRDISLWLDKLTCAKGEVEGLLKVIQVRPLRVRDVWTAFYCNKVLVIFPKLSANQGVTGLLFIFPPTGLHKCFMTFFFTFLCFVEVLLQCNAALCFWPPFVKCLFGIVINCPATSLCLQSLNSHRPNLNFHHP